MLSVEFETCRPEITAPLLTESHVPDVVYCTIVLSHSAAPIVHRLQRTRVQEAKFTHVALDLFHVLRCPIGVDGVTSFLRILGGNSIGKN